MAVSGEPQHKVVLKILTSTLGFFDEIHQYAREYFRTKNILAWRERERERKQQENSGKPPEPPGPPDPPPEWILVVTLVFGRNLLVHPRICSVKIL